MKTFFSLLVSLFLFVSVGAFGCSQPYNWTLNGNSFTCTNFSGTYICATEGTGEGAITMVGADGSGDNSPSTPGTASQNLCAQIYSETF